MRMVSKCAKCGKEGKTVKTWFYGPKKHKGPSFDVSIYECASGHRWREYLRKKA